MFPCCAIRIALFQCKWVLEHRRMAVVSVLQGEKKQSFHFFACNGGSLGLEVTTNS